VRRPATSHGTTLTTRRPPREDVTEDGGNRLMNAPGKQVTVGDANSGKEKLSQHTTTEHSEQITIPATCLCRVKNRKAIH
jgi:hypothetical protein